MGGSQRRAAPERARSRATPSAAATRGASTATREAAVPQGGGGGRTGDMGSAQRRAAPDRGRSTPRAVATRGVSTATVVLALACLAAWCTAAAQEISPERDAGAGGAGVKGGAGDAGGAGGILVHLPGSVDPNTDVLFNMQTRRVEEMVFLAGASDRWVVSAG
ncbi:hypothetical protein T484DRAFT_1890476 [Baffinella frigidus]|nr:hypothetical protein T484DRAFT_1890476 [Cryptophyta sp. CCMP2293]